MVHLWLQHLVDGAPVKLSLAGRHLMRVLTYSSTCMQAVTQHRRVLLITNLCRIVSVVVKHRVEVIPGGASWSSFWSRKLSSPDGEAPTASTRCLVHVHHIVALLTFTVVLHGGAHGQHLLVVVGVHGGVVFICSRCNG